ncbi:Nonaspanin (TM9SF) [Artemisia annua]|uniref:Nonaspanin (TM9SF) n=1 Tax=Artemisia annua TaxID=35608 RepID=A0A2U1PZT4_ARTAN|nr:Nonaspanin (TM9SF) [Artemisia annua]
MGMAVALCGWAGGRGVIWSVLYQNWKFQNHILNPSQRHLIQELGPCSLKITYSAHTHLKDIIKLEKNGSFSLTNLGVQSHKPWGELNFIKCQLLMVKWLHLVQAIWLRFNGVNHCPMIIATLHFGFNFLFIDRILDNLPLVVPMTSLTKEEKYFINNHLTFTVKYHKDIQTDYATIIGFEVNSFRMVLAVDSGYCGASDANDGMLLKEDDDEDVLLDDDFEGALGGGGEFGLPSEGGVVTSSSFARSTKRGLDKGQMVILGFLVM